MKRLSVKRRLPEVVSRVGYRISPYVESAWPHAQQAERLHLEATSTADVENGAAPGEAIQLNCGSQAAMESRLRLG